MLFESREVEFVIFRLFPCSFVIVNCIIWRFYTGVEVLEGLLTSFLASCIIASTNDSPKNSFRRITNAPLVCEKFRWVSGFLLGLVRSKIKRSFHFIRTTPQEDSYLIGYHIVYVSKLISISSINYKSGFII